MDYCFSKIISISLFCLCFLILHQNAQASISLPWNTSFDCPEWQEDELIEYANGWPPNCNGIEVGLWSELFGTQITSDANNLLGEGRGMRFWKGDSSEFDPNNESTIARIYFESGQTDFWVRWYMRYESGFTWSTLNYDKLVYLYNGDNPMGGVELTDWDEIGLWNNAPSIAWTATDCGFQTMMNGNISDASWHAIEAHFKMDSDSTDGIGQLWVDGELKVDRNNLDWSNGNVVFRNIGWTSFMFDHNEGYPNNGRPMYVDWDDIAISNSGYIGLLDIIDDTSAPDAPSGLNIL